MVGNVGMFVCFSTFTRFSFNIFEQQLYQKQVPTIEETSPSNRLELYMDGPLSKFGMKEQNGRNSQRNRYLPTNLFFQAVVAM